MHPAPVTTAKGSRTLQCVVAVIVAAAATVAAATAYGWVGPPPRYQQVALSGLTVTQGTVSQAGAWLETRDPGMRATATTGGFRRAPDLPSFSARLQFSFRGNSTTTVPLGSGEIRRQIGLKLRAADPCNLVYVMWWRDPTPKIQVTVKRNPGQTTSQQCGNSGYTTIKEYPVSGYEPLIWPPPSHQLEVRTRRLADGGLELSVYADGALRGRPTIPAALAAGLNGPIGIRSDNGHYLFKLYKSTENSVATRY